MTSRVQRGRRHLKLDDCYLIGLDSGGSVADYELRTPDFVGRDRGISEI